MNVPKLRFKDENGQDFPEWEENTLGYHLEYLQSGKSKGKDENGSFILYGSTGSIGFCKHFDYQGEHILIARVGANAGYLYEVNGQYGVSDNTLILSLKYPNNQSFFYNLLNYLNLNKLVFGSGQPLITGGLLKTLLVFVPHPLEQTKIANFLRAVDEKIEQLIQQVSLLQRYKKGVMQQIFSQQLRFKDENGQDFPEWEEKSLGDVCRPKQWKTISSKELISSGYCVYGANGFIGYYIEYNHEMETVAITCRGATCGEVNLIPAKSYITGNAMCLDDIDPLKNNHRFIYYAMKNCGFADFISGSAQPQIVGASIRKVKFYSPSLPEQTKIASFLSAIDDRITNAQQQLDATKQYKKSLLQQMFV